MPTFQGNMAIFETKRLFVVYNMTEKTLYCHLRKLVRFGGQYPH